MSLIQYQSFSITYNLYGIKYKSYNMTEWLMPGKTYKKQWEYSYNVHSKCKVVEMFQFHFLYAIALFCIDSSFCVLDSIRLHLEIAWNLVAHSERIFEKFYAINRLDGECLLKKILCYVIFKLFRSNPKFSFEGILIMRVIISGCAGPKKNSMRVLEKQWPLDIEIFNVLFRKFGFYLKKV